MAFVIVGDSDPTATEQVKSAILAGGWIPFAIVMGVSLRTFMMSAGLMKTN